MLGGIAGALPGGFGGGMAGGVAAGAITSLLLGSKGGRAFAGQALKLGAAAALGGGSPTAPIPTTAPASHWVARLRHDRR